MKLNKLDLIVQDVPEATAFFRDILGLPVNYAGERFAEMQVSDDFVLMLSPDALIRTQPTAGVILHFEVENVVQALETARERGATVLLEPTQTDWGWHSAMIRGPEDSVIDLYHPITNPA